MSEFWIRLLFSLLGVIASTVIRLLWDDWRSKGGDLTGDWIQNISEYQSEPEKQDRIIVKHNHITRKVAGKIIRIYPEEQSSKQWDFEGHVRNNLVFIVFLTANVKENPGSYGTIQLQRINEGEMRGFYARADTKATNESLTSELNTIGLEWKRVSPK